MLSVIIPDDQGPRGQPRSSEGRLPRNRPVGDGDRHRAGQGQLAERLQRGVPKGQGRQAALHQPTISCLSLGWWNEALPWLDEHDELPAPKVFNYSADGEWDNAVDGPDGGTPHFTRIPLMTRSQWERIGPWPEIDYGADVWLSERGRTLGIETRMFHTYAFVHHWNQVGRIDTPERLRHSEAQLNALRATM